MRERIQTPLKAGDHWPASETPFKWRFADWWPNMECWLGSLVILRGTGLVCIQTLFLVIFQGGGSGLPAPPPPLESAHELYPFHGFAWKLTTSRYKIVRLHRHKNRDLLFLPRTLVGKDEHVHPTLLALWKYHARIQEFSPGGRGSEKNPLITFFRHQLFYSFTEGYQWFIIRKTKFF